MNYKKQTDKPDSFRIEWGKAAAFNFEKFYADEADYSDVEVKEPNPNFRLKPE